MPDLQTSQGLYKPTGADFQAKNGTVYAKKRVGNGQQPLFYEAWTTDGRMIGAWFRTGHDAIQALGGYLG